MRESDGAAVFRNFQMPESCDSQCQREDMALQRSAAPASFRKKCSPNGIAWDR